ncbi:sigma-70 family RNA polymerase sigma factor [Jeotgalibacillus sp. ET6]|uniref:sigma-70 family RNA polymerase sigma factor n=1 Tax=Jeotgalibacillus sp. ET6 TaxID=3037260 RepID=UPI0024188508|nr:sigma-70 family RNA polymerase sigma factor [Jeotgalibacillus sp. ET6]MDG5472098.1 sigma-70 family RNA polymerase sigma factor [Jeotgalibacillus sp. ET6]
MQNNRVHGVVDLLTEEEFQALYSKLQRYCQGLARNQWDSEDLMQNALMKLWLHYANQSLVPTALVNKMARNEWIDTIRKRSKEILEADLEEKFLDDPINKIEDRFEITQKLIRHLTPKQVVMYVLKEGFRYQLSEIADIFSTTETAVKSTIHRAKQRLMKQQNEEGSPLIDLYWEEEERERVEHLLHLSFKKQDPTVLIESIPFLHSLVKNSMHRTKAHSRSSSTVLMAA